MDNLEQDKRNISCLKEHPEAKKSKSIILRINKNFCGSLDDIETSERVTVCRNTYYKYKRELKEEIENTSIDYVLRKYPVRF